MIQKHFSYHNRGVRQSFRYRFVLDRRILRPGCWPGDPALVLTASMACCLRPSNGLDWANWRCQLLAALRPSRSVARQSLWPPAPEPRPSKRPDEACTPLSDAGSIARWRCLPWEALGQRHPVRRLGNVRIPVRWEGHLRRRCHRVRCWRSGRKACTAPVQRH